VAILKAEGNIKHKEEMGDDLKFIDFHQMQISNKKHIKDIDERNNKLLKYKMSFANTQHTLNKLKQNLALALKTQEDYKREIETKTTSLLKNEKDVFNTKNIIEKALFFKKKQLNLQNQLKDMADPLTFVKQMNQYTKEMRDNKDWNRKIEIA